MTRNRPTRTGKLIRWIGSGCLLVIIGLTPPKIAARSLAEIRAANEIRMCVAGSSYELYTDMGMAFVEWLGVQAAVRRLDSWDQQFHNAQGVTVKAASYTPALLASGECDFYPNDLVAQAWRATKLDFVILFRTRMTVIVHRDNQAAFASEADLKGKTAAIQQGTSYHAWLEEKNAADFADNPIRLRFMTTDDSMHAVERQTADFTIIGADGALNWTRNKIKQAVVVFPIGDVTEVGWAFRQGDADLQDAARAFFASQRKVGSQFDAIWQARVGISLSDFTLFITNLLHP